MSVQKTTSLHPNNYPNDEPNPLRRTLLKGVAKGLGLSGAIALCPSMSQVALAEPVSTVQPLSSADSPEAVTIEIFDSAAHHIQGEMVRVTITNRSSTSIEFRGLRDGIFTINNRTYDLNKTLHENPIKVRSKSTSNFCLGPMRASALSASTSELADSKGLPVKIMQQGITDFSAERVITATAIVA